jgi:Tautomerase enzyme
MPFVNISLARGKSAEYLEAVSRAVHDALVAELHMKPEDDFQLIRQHEPGELVFTRNFRGGPRTGDWIVFTITDGLDRGEQAKRRFYQTLVRLLGEGPGVRPADVFVMMNVTPPENFSFADGVIGTDVAAAEALEAAAQAPGSRAAYTKTEMAYAITRLLGYRDIGPVLPMLPQDFSFKIPASLPWGGSSPALRPSLTSSRGPPAAQRCWSPSTSPSIRSSSPLTTSSRGSPTRPFSRGPASRWCSRMPGSSRSPADAWSTPSSTPTPPLSAPAVTD